MTNDSARPNGERILTVPPRLRKAFPGILQSRLLISDTVICRIYTGSLTMPLRYDTGKLFHGIFGVCHAN